MLPADPPKKVGECVIITGKGNFKLKITERDEEVRSVSLSENQSRILRELNAAPEGLIATEISRSLSLTPAGVLYLLKHLLDKNIVTRIPLRGGRVLYFMRYDITEERLAPELEAYLKEMESASGKEVGTLSIEELSDYLQKLPDGDRRTLIKWLAEGTWRRCR